jgi:Putative Actinobacterial Holin-X, holin superfamily III
MHTERTISGLAFDLAGQMGDLVRKEVQLARVEAMEGVRHIGAGIVRAAIGIAFVGAAVTLGLFAIAYALDGIVPRWAGALIAAAVGALIAFVLIKSGLKAASLENVSLPRTRQTVAQNIKVTKETMS